MNNFKITIIVIVVCCVRFSEPSPIAQLKAVWDGMDLSSEENAFMVGTHVTQEEVEEYQRLNGLIISSSENHTFDDEEIQQGQGRSLGYILPELPISKEVGALAIGVGAAFKFWKLKSAFDGFRIWIEERRHQPTTVKPIAVYFVENPNKAHYR